MTSFFGGFSDIFYSAYKSAFTLAPDYAVRESLYQLYHLLNHLNLFEQVTAEEYFQSSSAMPAKMLAEYC